MVKSNNCENELEAGECEQDKNYDSKENAAKKLVTEEEEEEHSEQEVQRMTNEPQEPTVLVQEEIDEPDPPDGGYGWVIVIGAFASMVLCGGFMKCGGLFFLQFKSRFQSGALKAAWPNSLMSTIANFSGPLIAAVCNRYSMRTSMMIGTTLLFIGLVLNSVADNYYFLFFCHSLLQGIGLGFASIPAPLIVSLYFEKRRGFATSLVSSGMGVGTFAIVPLVNFLFDFYGFGGCFLILAAIMSHGFVIALLYRPLSRHHKFLRAEKFKNKSLWEKDESDNTDPSCVPLKEVTDNGRTQEVDVSQTVKTNNPDKANHFHDNGIEVDPYNTGLAHQPQRKDTKSCPELRSCFKICFPTEHSRKGKKKKKAFNFELLKNVSFDFHLLSVVLFLMTLKAAYTFIPAACLDKGMSKTDAALVLSIVGALDCFGRIGFGFALDFPRLKPWRPISFNVFLFVVAVAIVCIPFLDSFLGFAVVCSVMGVCAGAHSSQRPVVLVDLMGKDLLPSSMGLIKLFQGIGHLLGPLLFGALRDATGAYDIAFYAGSGLMVTSGLCLALSNLVWHIQHRKDKDDVQTKPEEMDAQTP